MSKKTIVNDPIWGTIELHDLCVRVIDTPEFQRLRSIKQLGGCSHVYPGACHSRFEHSIGTSYLAGRLGRALQKQINEQGPEELKISETEILCLELGGLCHDLGHGPFSHLFDLMFYPRVEPREKNSKLSEWKHEDTSVKMTKNILERILDSNYLKRILDSNGDTDVSKEDIITFVSQLIKKPSGGKYKTLMKIPGKEFLFEIIANELNTIDVDKWDYFSRDCHMLGLHHNFQCERTIKLAKVVKHDGKWHISYPKSEWFNLFDMFYTRFTLHRRAYQHPVVKAVEIMITDALLKADRYLTFPPGADNGVCLSASVKEENMNAYLRVTDEVLHRIRIIELPPPGEEDPEKKDIYDAKRILDRIDRRDLYKLVGENKITWRYQRDKKNRKECIQSLKEWIKPEKFTELLKEIEEDLAKSYNPEKKKEYLQSLKEWMKPEKLKEWMKKNIIEEDDLKLYHTELVTFSYGNKDKSPLENVKFYQKDTSVELQQDESVTTNDGNEDRSPLENVQYTSVELQQDESVTTNDGNKDRSPLENVKYTSVELQQDEISAMLPTEFEQVYIRLYWKGTKDKKPNKKILDKFHNMKEDFKWADFVPTKRTEV